MDTIKTPFPRLAMGIAIGFGMMLMGFLTTAALLVPLKVMAIDPNGYSTSYGLVAGVSAFFALIGNPIGGAISDRSTVAFGRRRLWILLGSLLGSLSIMWVLFSTSVISVVLAWAAAQFFFNFSWAAYTALIPDQVDESKRGTMSGIVGIIMPISIVIGIALINIFNNATDTFKFTLFACIGVIGPILSLFFIKEGKIKFVKNSNNKSIVENIKKIYPNPKKYPEFTWALLSKFLLRMDAATLYLTIMLGSRMHMNKAEITANYSKIMLITLVFTAITSILGGVLSDKTKKQKIYLYISSIVVTIGTVMFIVADLKWFFIASAVLAIGTGCFNAVDTALVSRVLPNKKDTAKDFGIMNVANTLPQSIVPAIAPLLLSIGGWNFFYIFLGIMPLLGMLTIKPIPDIGKKLQHEREAEANMISEKVGN